MQAVPLSPELRAAAPVLAGRLRAILLAMIALIARGFLRNPFRVALIVPLCNRLNRAARRFDRLLARIAEGKDQPRPPRTRHPADAPDASPASPRSPVALPARHGWLVADLRHEAAAYTSQLSYLLSEPETAALIAHSPRLARLLRPLCHMLGLRHPALPPRTPRPKPPAAPARRSGNTFVTAPQALPADPPFRPLHETIPCEHVFWPWFPRKAARTA